MSVSIERLTSVNCNALAGIGPDVFDEAIDPNYLRLFVDDPRHTTYLAIDDSTVIGMAPAADYFHADKPPQL